MRRERMLRLDLPRIQVAERKSARGGHVCPTITCNPECIYVYEVIYDSSNEEQEP